MINFTELSFHETITLCGIVASGKDWKKYFQKNSHFFSQIKPGFRSSSLTDTEAVKLAAENLGKKIIAEYIEEKLAMELKKIAKMENEKETAGRNTDEALAEVLAGSVFSSNPELYFKVAGLSQNERCIRTIKEKVDHVEAKKENTVEQQRQNSEILEDAESEFSTRLRELKEENKALRQKLEECKSESEWASESATDRYDDSARAELVHSEDYDFTSICEVSEPDYKGQRWLTRLADIERTGKLEPFVFNSELSQYYSNRSRLYYDQSISLVQGITEVWNWRSEENFKDPSRDIVISSRNLNVCPIEIITLICKNKEELIEAIKRGIQKEVHSARVLFAVKLSSVRYYGFLCDAKELDVTENGIFLKNDVWCLPYYEFMMRDIVSLSNGRNYYKYICIGRPKSVEYVKDPLEIVRKLVFDRTTWQLIKARGNSRNDYKVIRDYLQDFQMTELDADIARNLNCNKDEAQRLLNEFIKKAGSYFDGTTMEDEILRAAIFSNAELQERCRNMGKDIWIAEHSTEMLNAEMELDTLKNRISAATEELGRAKNENESATAELRKIQSALFEQQQLAENIEKDVAERIERARNNAASFIAEMAFFRPVAQNDVASRSEVDEDGGDISEKGSYICGREIVSESICVNDDWNDVVDSIRDELAEAGIASQYVTGFAAFLYAAYIQHISLLLVGPNARAIVNAFSGAVFCRTAGRFECGESYDDAIRVLKASSDAVVCIENPFWNGYISKLPEIIATESKYFYACHPFSEDLKIEPKSLFCYFLPVNTELLVETAPSGTILGGRKSDCFQEFQFTHMSKHEKKIDTIFASPYVKKKMSTVLETMHSMMNDSNTDYDVLFAYLPYAEATMQTDSLLESIREKKLTVSKELEKVLAEVYGDRI